MDRKHIELSVEQISYMQKALGIRFAALEGRSFTYQRNYFRPTAAEDAAWKDLAAKELAVYDAAAGADHAGAYHLTKEGIGLLASVMLLSIEHVCLDCRPGGLQNCYACPHGIQKDDIYLRIKECEDDG